MINNIVLSTRIRLARNLSKYPFISAITNKDAQNIINDIENTVLSSNDNSKNFFRVISSEELKNEGGKLIEEHLISPVILTSQIPSSVIIDKNREISIMINEEDHLRIQVIKEGLNLKEAYKLACICDDLIEERNEYAFNEKYGFLTSCPTNVGTGMRASVMLHLPAITMSGQMSELTRTVNRLGIAVRGYYGEGTGAFGNIYQFSNQITLGLSEKEILDKLENIVNQIIEQEKELRKNLKGDLIKDKVMRSYGILTNCYLINFEEFCTLWSNVLMGIDLKIIENIERESFKSLIIKAAPNYLNTEDPATRDKMRAELIRKEIKYV